MTYFNGESVSATMLRLRGQDDMERYELLIDEQLVIGWDNLLGGKFSKQWKNQQKAFIFRRKMLNPRSQNARRVQRNKKRTAAKDKTTSKKKNKTEAFHAFFQAIIPTILEIWTDRCIDRNKPNMTHYLEK